MTEAVISVNSDKSNDNPVAVESNPAPNVISVRSKLIVTLPLDPPPSKPVPTLTLVISPVLAVAPLAIPSSLFLRVVVKFFWVNPPSPTE